MEKELTSRLKSLKEEFDFLHKKIGELEWERATIYYGKKAILRSDSELLEDRINSYADNMDLLLEKIRNEVTEANKTEKQ